MQVEMIILSLVAFIGIIAIVGISAWAYYFKDKDAKIFVMPEREVWIELLKRVEKLEKIVIKSKKIKGWHTEVIE
jgi:hypothetical protein